MIMNYPKLKFSKKKKTTTHSVIIVIRECLLSDVQLYSKFLTFEMKFDAHWKGLLEKEF